MRWPGTIPRAVAIVAILVVALPSAAWAETVRVAVAISLREAFETVARDYHADTGDDVVLNFGSSGQLLAQIRNGAEIDAFVSAANAQVDALVNDGLADAATRRVVAGNALVLVVPADASDPPASFAALADASVARVAIGEPKTVPAGQYAAQVFGHLKLTDAVKGKLVYGANVRQVLDYVERGEVSAGVVYATDARQSGDKVRVTASAPEGSHEPVVYPAVVVKASPRPDAAKRFLDYLATEKARAALRARGFTVPDLAPPATKPAYGRAAPPQQDGRPTP